MTADRADEVGLTVATIGEKTGQRLKEFVPKFASSQVTNPFDVTSVIAENPASVGDMAEAFFEDPAVGGLLVITAGSGEPGKARMQALLDHANSSKKAGLRGDSGRLKCHTLLPTPEIGQYSGLPLSR